MKKEEVLEEYFLEEVDKTEDLKDWKIIGKIKDCNVLDFPTKTLLELKTGANGWLCDFKIKLLGCGLVLCNSDYIIEENDLVMEAVEKIWKADHQISNIADLIKDGEFTKLDITSPVLQDTNKWVYQDPRWITSIDSIPTFTYQQGTSTTYSASDYVDNVTRTSALSTAYGVTVS